MERGVLQVVDLGSYGYWDTYLFQQQLINLRYNGSIPDTLILVEHPPVFTIGRGGSRQNLLVSQQFLEQREIGLFEIDRGGDITYHGPGQIVGYPILNLKQHQRDVHMVLRRYEEAIINLLADFGISAGRKARYTGVWVGEEKIAAIGIGAKRWITFHGFALNVKTDLAYFREIVPCGIPDKGVTSLSRLLGRTVELEEVKPLIINRFAEVFGWHEIEQLPISSIEQSLNLVDQKLGD